MACASPSAGVSIIAAVMIVHLRHPLFPLAALLTATTLTAPASALAPAEPRVLPAVPTAAEAPVALLVDLTSGQVLHARDPDRRFMPASVTKVMTMYLAFELIEAGRLDPRQVFVMSPAIARD